MLENEFERKVQQKMEEFRLRPSDAVWGKVEGELKRKKKRRVVFFIFLLAGLSLLGYSGYFLINQSKQNLVEQNLVEQNSTPSQVAPEGHSKTVSPPAGFGKNTQIPSVKDKTVEIESRDQSEKGNEKIPGEYEDMVPTVTGNGNQEKIEGGNDKIAAGKNKTPQVVRVPVKQDKMNNRLPFLAQKEKSRKLDAEISRDDEKLNVEIKPAEEQDIVRAETPVKDLIEDPSAGKEEDSTVKADEPEPAITDKEAAKELTAKPKKGIKINWGFDVSAGVSDGRKSAFPFSASQKSLDVYSSPLPITPGNAAYLPPMTPSSVEPGYGFKIGPAGELDLSKRSRVSFGIQYAYMSSKMKIGTYSDTSLVVNNSASQNMRVAAVYRGFYRQDYTNRYHFIQIPVTFQLQLNKGKKLPLSWTAGVSAGYLLATNGLLYDTTAGGIYYRDKQAFNKFQFNLHSGFAFRFGSRQRLQWSVGPEVSLAMNKLVKNEYSRKQYLLYGGLTGRLIFSKKK